MLDVTASVCCGMVKDCSMLLDLAIVDAKQDTLASKLDSSKWKWGVKRGVNVVSAEFSYELKRRPCRELPDATCWKMYGVE